MVTNLLPLAVAVILVSSALFMLLEAFQRSSGNSDDARKQFPDRATVSSFYDVFKGHRILSGIPFVTNLVGTITSLATVYIFFIGNAKTFGWLIFLCPFTIILSAYVTNALTRKLIQSPRLCDELSDENRGHFTAVVARLLWDRSKSGRQVSSVAKWISIITVLSIIWIEVSIAVDIGFALTVGPGSPSSNLLNKGLAVFFITGIMLYYVFRYGVRGVAIGDVILTPIVGVATVALLVGSAVIFFGGASSQITPGIREFFAPNIDSKVMLCMFAVQVFVVNFFTIVTTEAHWLRAWAYTTERTLGSQKIAVLIAAGLWSALCLIGYFAYYSVQSAHPGVAGSEDIVTYLLQMLQGKLGAVFLMLFWAGATAALFSIVDAQLYSFLLCWNFKPSTGLVLNPPLPTQWRTLARSFLCGLLFAGTYTVTRAFNIPVEAIAFLMIPLSLTLLPSLCRIATNRPPSVLAIVLPLLFYGICMTLSLIRPEDGLLWPLLAPICAVIAAAPSGLRDVFRRTKSQVSCISASSV